MPTVVFTPTVHWSWMKQRPQHLAEQFAAHGWHVYYCQARPSHEGLLAPVVPRLWLARAVPRLQPEVLATAPPPVIVWHSWPLMGRRFGRWGQGFAVYDCLDEFKRWEKLEKQFVPRVDLVFASSERLAQRMRGMHPKVTLVRNACDYNHFVVSGGGGDAYPATQRKVTFVGTISSWVDAELMAELARIRPDLQFRFVGPSSHSWPEPGLPANVETTGHVLHHALPAMLAEASVGLVPFRICPTSLAADPVKVYEYLAAGVPVVSTRIPEVARWGKLVSLADDARGFAAAIDLAVSTDTPELRAARRAAARQNTWGHRFGIIEAALTHHCLLPTACTHPYSDTLTPSPPAT